MNDFIHVWLTSLATTPCKQPCKLEVHWLDSAHIHVLLGPHNVFEELELVASTPSLHTHRIWGSDLLWHCGPSTELPVLGPSSSRALPELLLSQLRESVTSERHPTPKEDKAFVLIFPESSHVLFTYQVRKKFCPQSPKAKKRMWEVMDQRQEAERKPWVQMTRTFYFLKRDEDLVLSVHRAMIFKSL